MILIKKLTKINELFSLDGQNIFPYEEHDGNYYFSNSGKIYKVEITDIEYYDINGKDISYGIENNSNDIDYQPEKTNFNQDKAKVVNTVIHIVKEVIKSDPEGSELLTFSGNIDNGLGNFYELIIRSLKLKEKYFIKKEIDNMSVQFILINRNINIIDEIPGVIIFQDNNKIIRAELHDDVLFFSTVYGKEDKKPCERFVSIIEKMFENVSIVYYVDSNNEVEVSWEENIEVNQEQINKVIRLFDVNNFDFMGKGGRKLIFKLKEESDY